MDIHYICTDLDIESYDDLSIVLSDLGEDVLVQHHGRVKDFDHASIVLAHTHYSGPDDEIEGFCTQIENLSVEARRVWDSCFTRVLDLGFKWGDSHQRFRFELRPSTIKRVTAIGASIAVSLYPTKGDEPNV